MIADGPTRAGDLVYDGDELVGVCAMDCGPGDEVECFEDLEAVMEALQRRAMN